MTTSTMGDIPPADEVDDDQVQRRDANRGATAIIGTHDQRVTRFADRTVHIIDGRIDTPIARRRLTAERNSRRQNLTMQMRGPRT